MFEYAPPYINICTSIIIYTENGHWFSFLLHYVCSLNYYARNASRKPPSSFQGPSGTAGVCDCFTTTFSILSLQNLQTNVWFYLIMETVMNRMSLQMMKHILGMFLENHVFPSRDLLSGIVVFWWVKATWHSWWNVIPYNKKNSVTFSVVWGKTWNPYAYVTSW